MTKARALAVGCALAVGPVVVLLLPARQPPEPIEKPRVPSSTASAAADSSGDSTLGDLQPIEKFVDENLEVRADWETELFHLASSSQGERYEKGSSPYSRPFDDSDPDMQALMGQVYAQGGCAQPGRPCEPAHNLMRLGGNRLADYLIRQFELGLEQGYPDRLTYLSYIAYTESDSGFRYIRDRVRNREELSLDDQRYAARALSYTAEPKAIPIAFELLESEHDIGILKSAVNTLWRVPIVTGELSPSVLDTLVALNSGELHDGRLRVTSGRALEYLRSHFDVEHE